ncbi:hypothetical protein [Riemerella anatipestifer]|uniref:Uncharacterized protein n=1 Tax=Riemerella anatipestifer RA-CH-1 TaxID=1228997 RepID=J9QTI1_RIEAN|nr:hypothetical protein [Riemerella anatipestifer]WCS66385.1 hypothetical protein CRP5_000030 [Riemerella phage vB_RanS_CRP5]WIL01305.1 hypothetical protein CRP6_000025 [Riemerella phage vB_RanS_CRP6]AFR35961.1 hypothetical protein B739_1363 [Riemerella anatipestifer RA-CH-1]MBT0535825.1 hypothetical protein [Riemerella anatipestifer]MDD1548805.1 hypothetical protein [Riemerella anatipestifer]
MKKVKKTDGVGRQIVVFDQVDATYAGGVHINAEKAKERFSDGVVPAGTLLIPDTEGMFKPLNEDLSAVNVVGAIGLTAHDVVIDDMPLVAVVMAGTARKDALPDKEKAGVGFIKTVLPRISFV